MSLPVRVVTTIGSAVDSMYTRANSDTSTDVSILVKVMGMPSIRHVPMNSSAYSLGSYRIVVPSSLPFKQSRLVTLLR